MQREFLIVDDNLALAENLAEIISDADLGRAVVVDSGMRALELATTIQFDALVSDVRMPRMTGVELFQKMRLVDPGLPVVLMTAHAVGDELVSAQHENLLCILPKPVPIARLLYQLAHARRYEPGQPLAQATESRRSQPVVQPDVVAARSSPERVMNDLENLCYAHAGHPSMRSPYLRPMDAVGRFTDSP